MIPSPALIQQWEAQWLFVLQALLGEIKLLKKPIKTSLKQQTLDHSILKKSGEILVIPSFNPDLLYEVTKVNGHIFTQADLLQANIIKSALDALLKTIKQEQMQDALERKQLMRDLHDDVNPLLLSLVHRQLQPELSQIARQAVGRVRESIYSLDNSKQVFLLDILHELETEAAIQLSEAGKLCIWRQWGSLDNVKLTGRQRINFSRAVEEAITNAIRHGNRGRVDFETHVIKEPEPLNGVHHPGAEPTVFGRLANNFFSDEGHIEYPHFFWVVTNSVANADFAAWPKGTGQIQMLERLREICGDVHWYLWKDKATAEETKLSVLLHFSLKPPTLQEQSIRTDSILVGYEATSPEQQKQSGDDSPKSELDQVLSDRILSLSSD